MAIRESLLNTITSVASSDFVRLVTSAGESSKATVANLFKSFETGLSAKSSLTTSDYIRVVGSDNNLYKQSLSSVKSDMGVSALETSVSNLNNIAIVRTADTETQAQWRTIGSGTQIWFTYNKTQKVLYVNLYVNGEFVGTNKSIASW